MHEHLFPGPISGLLFLSYRQKTLLCPQKGRLSQKCWSDCFSEVLQRFNTFKLDVTPTTLPFFLSAHLWTWRTVLAVMAFKEISHCFSRYGWNNWSKVQLKHNRIKQHFISSAVFLAWHHFERGPFCAPIICILKFWGDFKRFSLIPQLNVCSVSSRHQ